MTDPVPAVGRLRTSVPAGVEQAITRSLASTPADRFASAAEFAEALNKPTVARSNPRTVAVLPFLNLSADPENEYFADGITEDVIAQLSKIHALKVVSRTSVMPFKKRELGLREIGARLQAGTLLDGSVRRAGDRVRIVAQLVDAETDQHLWAETYDRQLTDIFAIQSDVALQIAASLRASLSADETSRIRKEPTDDIQAYQLYLRENSVSAGGRVKAEGRGWRQSKDSTRGSGISSRPSHEIRTMRSRLPACRMPTPSSDSAQLRLAEDERGLSASQNGSGKGARAR